MGFYDPSSAVIIVGQSHREDFGRKLLNHEIYHLNQLSCTTAGLACVSALAYRNMWIELRLATLNEKFDSGLWSPVAGWLDDVYGGSADEFYDSDYPYSYISAMKRWIGCADSVLFGLGYFDTENNDDRDYWFDRFPWKDKFPDCGYSFYRYFVPGPWMTSGVRSLFESTTLYLELLDKYGDYESVNEHIWHKFHGPVGVPAPESRDFTYYGAFTECEFGNIDKPPPYHLLPICSFWALNTPIPHFAFKKEMAIRYDEVDLPWMQIAPPSLFGYLFSKCIDDKRYKHLKIKSVYDLLEIARDLQPIMEAEFGRGYLAKVIEQDQSFIEKCVDDIRPSRSYAVALSGIRNSGNSEARLASFFSYPPSLPAQSKAQIIDGSSEVKMAENVQLFVISHIGEHLFPTWSSRQTDRFRTARYLQCPSVAYPLAFLCPARGKCNGRFPGVEQIPKQCWFQDILASTLRLSVYRIGIVHGYEATLPKPNQV
jgi:hypothetical protein